jgi:hypothetical protein
MNQKKMDAKELALVLNINEKTIKKLANSGQIPCFCVKKRVYFNFLEVITYLKKLEEKNTMKGEETAFLYATGAITA